MVDAHAPAGARVTAAPWRGIDELARLVGAYCWTERRIFALAGSWASTPDGAPGGEDGAPAPELRIFCAALSRRHGALAERWDERLPVRAGVDAAALVCAPGAALEGALDELAAGPLVPGLAALVRAVLPRVRATYGAHLREAQAASEAPVMEVLVQAHRELHGEIRGGGTLLERCAEEADGAAPLVEKIERAFDVASVFPAVRPS